MDRPKFDTLTRTLGKRTDRRTGLLGAIGAWIGVAAAPETDAARKATRRHEKLACRNANSQCLSDDECCSGSCVPKFGGTQFRCAKRHGKKNHGARNSGGSTPINAPMAPRRPVRRSMRFPSVRVRVSNFRRSIAAPDNHTTAHAGGMLAKRFDSAAWVIGWRAWLAAMAREHP